MTHRAHPPSCSTCGDRSLQKLIRAAVKQGYLAGVEDARGIAAESLWEQSPLRRQIDAQADGLIAAAVAGK